jgi:hypothetical protein
MESQYTGLGGASAFAPANFDDAYDDQPLGAVFDMGGHGSSTPYSAAMGAIITKHTDEIKKAAAERQNLPIGWKKRLREFLAVKNNQLLDFLKISVASHPTLGPGEILLRKFGNPQVTPTHASVRDMVMDVSGEDIMSEMEVILKVIEKQGILPDYAKQTALIYEEYRKAGDEVLSQQVILKGKIDKFDRIQGRVISLFEIDPNEHYQALMESSEAYLKKIFDDNAIEADYKKLIHAYRRFAALRDIVSMSRSLLAQESEPICSICLDESVMYAFTPCGHTVCQSCMRRQSTTCFMCRVPIREKVKLFFG